ncbi:Ser/Thr protein kinase RdoA involved in Cpx stress response, MazF antagonist [Streptomyces sp. TLI_053]|uniref:phosphotransferase enzyme family protein n=1 Tax=Streptomyces sp. TLI_053 TaxID=1855352 RepID=UPI00087BDD06|nr:aminoglycoside phosphotransferase family protein [Streptomyces sp. TLI_053]SDT83421.1 Ser/Thr protein kinase RdoA involved in Cpx stress response, MazF antagonist [Streptomyces sp. TLI_053]
MIDTRATSPARDALPDDLQRWLAGTGLPAVTGSTDTSWDRYNSKVWRLDTEGGPAFVKISPTTQDHDREVYAYRHVAAALDEHEAPRLIAADPGLHAVLTTALPGSVVRDLPLERETEQRVHRLAGAVLGRWHAWPEPAGAQARERILQQAADQADEAARCLETAGEHLSQAQRELVRKVSTDLPVLAAQVPVVFLHGDFSPRNWLWDAERESVGLIDFQVASHGLAVADLVWLFGAQWPTRPDLKDAFLAGYGRPLSEPERQLLPLLTARLAVSYLTTGVTEGNQMLVDRGRTALDHLAGGS